MWMTCLGRGLFRIFSVPRCSSTPVSPAQLKAFGGRDVCHKCFQISPQPQFSGRSGFGVGGVTVLQCQYHASGEPTMAVVGMNFVWRPQPAPESHRLPKRWGACSGHPTATTEPWESINNRLGRPPPPFPFFHGRMFLLKLFLCCSILFDQMPPQPMSCISPGVGRASLKSPPPARSALERGPSLTQEVGGDSHPHGICEQYSAHRNDGGFVSLPAWGVGAPEMPEMKPPG